VVQSLLMFLVEESPFAADVCVDPWRCPCPSQPFDARKAHPCSFVATSGPPGRTADKSCRLLLRRPKELGLAVVRRAAADSSPWDR
jgi:hypothetical protein